MRRLLRPLVGVLLALALAASANASTLDLIRSTLSLGIGSLPPVTVPGALEAIAVSSGVGTFTEPPLIFGPTTIALPSSLFTASPLIAGVTLAGFGNGSVACTQTGPPIGCIGGLAGDTLVNVLQLFNLTIPLTPIGSPGAMPRPAWAG